MEEFAIHCTEEQCKKALELGAPIEKVSHSLGEPFRPQCTAEQMTGWMEEQSNISTHVFPIEVDGNRMFVYAVDILGHKYEPHHTRKEATLAAIDVILDYLIQNKK